MSVHKIMEHVNTIASTTLVHTCAHVIQATVWLTTAGHVQVDSYTCILPFSNPLFNTSETLMFQIYVNF